jgi:hypothetical protein
MRLRLRFCSGVPCVLNLRLFRQSDQSALTCIISSLFLAVSLERATYLRVRFARAVAFASEQPPAL